LNDVGEHPLLLLDAAVDPAVYSCLQIEIGIDTMTRYLMLVLISLCLVLCFAEGAFAQASDSDFRFSYVIVKGNQISSSITPGQTLTFPDTLVTWRTRRKTRSLPPRLRLQIAVYCRNDKQRRIEQQCLQA
jgi:hypothetical protein